MESIENFSMKSPVGRLTLIASSKGLCAVLWENEKLNRVNIPLGRKNLNNPFIKMAIEQLTEYFEGKRKNFTVPLDVIGTDFQKNVWKNLQKVPYARTVSYKDIALKLKKPTASRAVGMANGKNPLSIIVPCHRIIASSGKLTGYAGGLNNKKILLDLEAKFS
ncbi:MAG: glycosyltransferase [Bdellovibrionales bacterium CG12_big_fil_rev_8_21_14_0_65_38_15]|nr:MAG: glycosyltransferase [Bdellovibrionales bacterium CG22_combo_CG10-13_8_21_14_all_38_13]PIQ52261.1 MAG: glycosyltransferase [Bdellovibrionales bacterium CG12_big_fil_rev_8_21_14_0_65_38_15]PIR29790.1 MAG: glycosyltransferase [Bdellovibrionales bacterium CG11_big_fil_rev_8_21_14_0_20_38_13]